MKLHEPINLDGFLDPQDVMTAVTNLSGTGSRLYRAYASEKVAAMNARLQGRINDALHFESLCERIYQRIPNRLKW